jgi:hypothetical protein
MILACISTGTFEFVVDPWTHSALIRPSGVLNLYWSEKDPSRSKASKTSSANLQFLEEGFSWRLSFLGIVPILKVEERVRLQASNFERIEVTPIEEKSRVIRMRKMWGLKGARCPVQSSHNRIAFGFCTDHQAKGMFTKRKRSVYMKNNRLVSFWNQWLITHLTSDKGSTCIINNRTYDRAADWEYLAETNVQHVSTSKLEKHWAHSLPRVRVWSICSVVQGKKGGKKTNGRRVMLASNIVWQG